MVGMFVYLCLASKKPSEREFFVPARTDLGVKLFTALPLWAQICAHFFNELCDCLNKFSKFYLLTMFDS
jgi:hypothetical protein